MSELLRKQMRFAVMFSDLVRAAIDMGYDVTYGHCFRCAECKVGKIGKKNSLHKLKLAGDLNLFKDGVYLTSSSDHKPLGELWESWGGTWGGRFQDGNHYSLTHNGLK